MNIESMVLLAKKPASTPTPVPADQQVIKEISGAVDTVTETAENYIARMPQILSRILLALAVLLIGWIVLRIGKWIIFKTIRRKNRKNAGSSQRADTMRSVTSSIYTYLLFFVMAAIILRIFGVDVRDILTVAGVGGVAIAFGAQTLVKDIISGMFIWGEGSISVGDLVTINDMTGTVESISIRTTVMRKYNGDLFTIPNGDIRAITNMSRGFRRAIVPIRCPYEENQQRIVEILKEEMVIAGQEIEGLAATPDVMSIVSFETDAVMIQIAVICPIGEHWRVERDIRSRVKARFDKEGIVMPHYTAPILNK